MNFINTPKISDFIWINGQFVPWEDSYIHVITHSLHYSGAAFEGIRSYNGVVFKLEEHIERLFKSAEYMGLKINFSARDINDAIYSLLDRNSLKDTYIRPLIWRGAESIGICSTNLSTHIMISAVHSKHDFAKNLKLILSKWRKSPAVSIPPQAKSSAHYAMAIVAQQNAQDNGYDDSLVLDHEGYVAECNVANIFFGKDNNLITPIADRFLNGITRQEVIKLAKNIGFNVVETRITLDELKNYDYCFMSGTSKEIATISEINLIKDIIYFKDQKNKVKILQEAFGKLVGK